MKRLQMSDLVGQKILSVEGMNEDSEIITIKFSNHRAQFWHEQDCCESVYVAEVIGDVSDLVGEVLLSFSEDESNDFTSPLSDGFRSYTWTFYTFRTIKGTVTVRWLGSSNGYYSENVDCMVVENDSEYFQALVSDTESLMRRLQ